MWILVLYRYCENLQKQRGSNLGSTFEEVQKVNDLRKSGHTAEAIVLARSSLSKNGYDSKMAGALAWCLYDEYLKPLTFIRRENSDPKFGPVMAGFCISDEDFRKKSLTALKDIRELTEGNIDDTLLNPHILGQLKFTESVYKYIKYGNAPQPMFDLGMELLIGIDRSRLAGRNPKNPDMPSTKDRFTKLALDFSSLGFVKNGDKSIKSQVVRLLKKIPAESLTNGTSSAAKVKEKGSSNSAKVNDLSPRQRYVMRIAKLSLEIGDNSETERVCRKALVENLFAGDKNEKWINYWLVKAIEETNPDEALRVLDQILEKSNEGFLLSLRATILNNLGRSEEALVSISNSLLSNVKQGSRKILSSESESSRKYRVVMPEMLSKSLQMFAHLSKDEGEVCAHIQAIRGQRLHLQHPPLSRFEELAEKYNLGPATPTNDFSSLIPIWVKYSDTGLRQDTTKKNRFLGRVIVIFTQQDGQMNVFASNHNSSNAVEHRAVVVADMPNVLYVRKIKVRIDASDPSIEDPESAGLGKYSSDMPKLTVSRETYVLKREQEPFLMGGGVLKILGDLSSADWKRISESWRSLPKSN